MKRLAAIVVAAVLAVGLLVHSATAAGPGQMTWTGTFWKDPVCGTGNAQFKVDIFVNVNYGGTRYRFCTQTPDFCWSPFGADSSDALLCSLGNDASTANDKASSMRVLGVYGGPACRVITYEDSGYSRSLWAVWDPWDLPDMLPLGDLMSSIKRRCD